MKRLLALLACLGAGLALGFVGHAASGRAEWFLAVPALLAAGWLWWADPTRCERRDEPRRAGRDRGAT